MGDLVKIGWVGLGKLGLPCALTLAARGGHTVYGYDTSALPEEILHGRKQPMQENGIDELLSEWRESPGMLSITKSTASVVENTDLIFTAVQTPHAPAYGGELPMPSDRRDFEYAFLTQSCRAVCTAAREQRKNITLAVVSTVLPGTVNRLLRPLLNEYTQLVYTPQFIAMGTTIADFCDPEFVICGVDQPSAAEPLRDAFSKLHGGDRLFVTSIETAEAIKVFYNVFISTKIVFGNAVMEFCHKTGADCDDVIKALALATDRVISPKYMHGGMGDGGACHPRDLIALSHLAQRLDLSYDLLGEIASAREEQTAWLAGMADEYADITGLPVTILGKAYKPESDLTYGSPALLLAHYLRHRNPAHIDVYTDKPVTVTAFMSPALRTAGVFVIATKHKMFRDITFPRGSVVIDPFGYISDQGDSVTVIRVGRSK